MFCTFHSSISGSIYVLFTPNALYRIRGWISTYVQMSLSAGQMSQAYRWAFGVSMQCWVPARKLGLRSVSTDGDFGWLYVADESEELLCLSVTTVDAVVSLCIKIMLNDLFLLWNGNKLVLECDLLFFLFFFLGVVSGKAFFPLF